MPFQVSPGVNWSERDLTNIVPGISTSIGGYAGAFQWGPVGQILTVSSEDNLVAQTGKPNDDTFRHFFQVAGFLAYSDNTKVVRVAGANARNAASGGNGTGLKLDVNATNGEVSSVSITAANSGTGYIIGDLVTLHGTVEDAVIRVTGVSNAGAVQSISLVSGGAGHITGTSVATGIVNNVRVDNDADALDDVLSPEIVAKYPGAPGNTLLFSSARASEFDKWEYRNRFAVAPEADVQAWSGNGVQTAFTLGNGLTDVPTDGIVTVDGFARAEGTDPGQYQVTGGAISFNEADETFTANGSQYIFTLVNAFSLDTAAARVKLDSANVTAYTGIATVPVGQVRVTGNTVEFGIGRAKFSGDSITKTFKIVGVTGIDDAIVKVDGNVKTVVYTGSPTAGQALVQTSGSDTTVTFAAGSEPAVGASNVEITWGYPGAASVVEVKYGAPKVGIDNVKLFTNQTEIHAVVVDKSGVFDDAGTILERYDFLSLVPGTKFYDGTTIYYADSINRRSQFVRIPGVLYSHGSKLLSGGVDANVDGTDITPGVLQNGYALYANADEVDVAHIYGAAGDAATSIYIIGNIAEVRRDVVFYTSVPQDAVVQNRNKEADDSVAYRNLLPSSSYATMDAGWKLVYDRYNDKTRWVPTCGDSAGIYAWTHDQYDAWWAGAGLNRGRIRNAIKMAFVPTKTDRDTLYANGINPIAVFRGEGPVLLGDKTLQTKASAFDRMNIRWLFIVLEKSISRAARYYLFEFNDEFTRNQFKNMVHPFLRDVMGRRGIEDFKIICDETNNTGYVRANKEFRGAILIKPMYAINFINLDFVAVGPDVNFDEIAAQA